MKTKFILGFLLMLLLSVSSVFAIINDATTYYSFDDADNTGSNPDDLSGNSNDGTSTGLTTGATGILNEAYNFGSGNDVLVAGTDTSFNPGSESMTIAFWYKGNGGNGNLLGDYASGTDGFTCYNYAAGQIRCTWSVTSGGYTESSATYRIDDDSWHHFVYVHTPANQYIYIDGTQRATTTNSYSGTVNFNNFRLNCRGDGAGGVASCLGGGLYDEFAYYERDLSSSEVSDLYNSGSATNPYDGAGSPTLSPLFSVTAKDATTTSTLENITVTLENGSIYTNATNAIVVTPINDSSLRNFTVSVDGYINQTFTNYNTSVNLQANLTAIPPTFSSALANAATYYSFDDVDNTGSNPLDVSGNGNTGINNGCTTGGTGILNESYSCVTTNTMEAVVGSSVNLASDDFSISFWIKTTGCDASPFGQYAGGTDGLNGYIYCSDGKFRTNLFGTDGGTSVDIVSTYPFDDGSWTHYTYTYTSGSQKAYHNGVERGTATDSKTGVVDTSNFLLGGRGDGTSGSTSTISAEFDEFAWYNRVLNSTEVENLYNSGLGFNPYNVPVLEPTLSGFTLLTVDGNDSNNLDYNDTFQYVNITASSSGNLTVNVSLAYPNGTFIIQNVSMTEYITDKYTYTGGLQPTVAGTYTLTFYAEATNGTNTETATQAYNLEVTDGLGPLTIADTTNTATTFDGETIYYDVYYYTESQTAKKGLVLLHDTFSTTADRVAMRTFAQGLDTELIVANIDTRGKGDSTGTHDLNGLECMDLYAVIEDLKASGEYAQYIDFTRVSSIGVSGGGATVLTCGAKHPDLYTSLVSFSAPTNYTQYYDETGASSQTAMQSYIGGTPTTNYEGYESRGVMAFYANLYSPLRLIHGDADTTVDVSHARDLDTLLATTALEYVYVEISGGTHAGPYQDAGQIANAAAWMKNHTTDVTLSDVETLGIAGYLKTDKADFWFNDQDYIGFVSFDVSSQTEHDYNFTAPLNTHTVNVTSKNLLNTQLYDIFKNDVFVETVISNSSGGLEWQAQTDSNYKLVEASGVTSVFYLHNIFTNYALNGFLYINPLFSGGNETPDSYDVRYTFNSGLTTVTYNQSGDFYFLPSNVAYHPQFLLSYNPNSSGGYNMSTFQSQILIEAREVSTNNTVAPANITINGVTKTTDEYWYIDAGTYDVTFSKSGYVNKTQQLTWSARDNLTKYILDVSASVINLSANNTEGGSIDEFEVIIDRGGSSSSSSTTNGWVLVPYVDGEVFNVSVIAEGFVSENNTINTSASSGYETILLARDNSLRLNFYDEQTLQPIYNVSFTLYSVDSEGFGIDTITTGANNTYLLEDLAEGFYGIEYGTGNYTLRNYFINAPFAANSQTNLDLYLLDSGEASNFIVTTTDPNNRPLEGVYGSVLRRYVIDGQTTYRVVEMFKPSFSLQGAAPFTAEANNVAYLFRIQNDDGEVLYQGAANDATGYNALYLIDSELFIKVATSGNSFDVYQDLIGFNYLLTNTSANTFWLSWSDTQNKITQICLNIKANNTDEISNVCSNEQSGILSYTVPESNSTYYVGRAIVTADSDGLDRTVSITTLNYAALQLETSNLFSILGVFLLALTLIVSAVAGAYNPPVGIMTAAFSVLAFGPMLLGFVYLSLTMQGSVFVAGSIAAYLTGGRQ